MKAIDEFLNQTIKSGFTEVSKAMFSKDSEVMLNAVTKHVTTLRNIGLTRLSALLNHQALSVKSSQGNTLLFIQYCRILNMELQKTRDEFKKIFQESVEEKKEELPVKNQRRLSDSETPKVIDLEKKPDKPVSAVKREFNLAPLPSTFNFVDKIKAPYEAPKVATPVQPKLADSNAKVNPSS